MNEYIYSIIYPKTRVNFRKIRKTLNRYIFDVNNFRSTSNDYKKRGILPFKILFYLSRYDFRFPRYHRVKQT